ncbi:tyrosine-type recombinase/integrase [Priestia megaterium]|uniref:Phage integrase family protein n=1 Tax=Priestia megaterium (strain ATCC 14581 / DSM 32 / CCUG 1817 / JCM 2506 / NBRC 15308 / NCIMB 9376 / NCTC 10342 / NRRL B-14308 / VKM B-512 / Ford 19) TaxID=1348623 RepID=A0A0B6ALL8_PRIM2|nr:tyrosine-type recombinase/integrase [Priestia megaterium]AJI25775.1 phage integrase family protein [Priestia megaterium NBRC 15308 = ATCC 14581]NER45049.1 tyrosine-type recombinase/integrase [Priestia megaterium NBRC 15308 = ATCC 14581]WEZ30999.1 tyrosine-type recombinase/integrase [Priestia megaterium]SUX82409.1 Tn554-related, transposase A [Priestia megaterium]
MRVEEISVGNRKAYLLIGTSGLPVEPVAKYMKYLYNSERSSNTLQTYCTALKFYFTYLEQTGIDYQQVSFEKLSNFVVWLRNPYENNNVVLHKTVKAKRRESTVNNYLTVVASFYDYLYRNDLVDSDMVEKLMKKMFIGAGGNGYKGFLHHVNGGKPISKNILKLKEPRKRVQVFTKEQVEEIYYSTTNIRDKFLVRLLFESGLRIGEVLSLFLEDLQFDAKQRKHKIQLTNRGELPNGGKLKTGERKLDISQGFMNLYDDYLYEVVDEYNPDHNFVFVKIWGKNAGDPLTYSDVYATFKELERKTGIHITPHMFRHTHATIYYLQTKNIKLVQERLGHAQIQTTMNLYIHPSEDEIRKDWEKAAHAFEIGQENMEDFQSNIPDEAVPF